MLKKVEIELQESPASMMWYLQHWVAVPGGVKVGAAGLQPVADELRDWVVEGIGSVVVELKTVLGDMEVWVELFGVPWTQYLPWLVVGYQCFD